MRYLDPSNAQQCFLRYLSYRTIFHDALLVTDVELHYLIQSNTEDRRDEEWYCLVQEHIYSS